MKVETSLNIGEVGYILFLNKIHTVVIDTITITVHNTGNVTNKYWIQKNPCGDNYTKCFDESEIFQTKEQLLESL